MSFRNMAHEFRDVNYNDILFCTIIVVCQVIVLLKSAVAKSLQNCLNVFVSNLITKGTNQLSFVKCHGLESSDLFTICSMMN